MTIAGSNADGEPRDITLHGAYFQVKQGARLILHNIRDTIGLLDFSTKQSLFFVNEGSSLELIGPGSYSNSGANPADLGGVIYNHRGRVTIEGADIQGSQAVQQGGAIFNDDGTVQISSALDTNGHPISSHISNNSAPTGAGIYSAGGNSTLVIADAFLTGNQATSDGGAIFLDSGSGRSGAALSLTRTTISGNHASSGAGVHSQNFATMAISQSTVSGNQAADRGVGGGLAVADSLLRVDRSTFESNSAGNGGAMYIVSVSAAGITRSLFDGNKAASSPSGAIEDTNAELVRANALTIVNSTFFGEHDFLVLDQGPARIISSTFVDAGVRAVSPLASVRLRNTILQGSSGCSGNLSSFTDAGHNLQFPGTGCPATVSKKSPGLDLANGLRDNGGPTRTIGLLQRSPAIDGVPLNKCTDQSGNQLKTDQRGFKRPAPKHKACDIGAFELGAASPPRRR